MSHFHAVVWLDHSEAHVMHISPDDVEKSIVHPSKPHSHLHARAGTPGSGRAPDDQAYYHRVAEALTGARAKLQLLKHFHAHDGALAARVVGVETVDHPTDAQVVAYARKYFRAREVPI